MFLNLPLKLSTKCRQLEASVPRIGTDVFLLDKGGGVG